MRVSAWGAVLASAAGLAAPAAAAPPEETAHAFIGAGLGSGSASYKVNGTTVTFNDRLQGSNDESPFIAVKVVSAGYEVRRTLYAGLDLTGVTQSGTVATNKTNLQISSYLGTLTWFPWEKGLFLKAGAGLASLFISSGSQSERSWGPAFLLSAGFALRLTGAHHLTFSAEQGWQWYSGSGATSPDNSQYSAGFIGYMWRN
jgi:hypothetical protein